MVPRAAGLQHASARHPATSRPCPGCVRASPSASTSPAASLRHRHFSLVASIDTDLVCGITSCCHFLTPTASLLAAAFPAASYALRRTPGSPQGQPVCALGVDLLGALPDSFLFLWRTRATPSRASSLHPWHRSCYLIGSATVRPCGRHCCGRHCGHLFERGLQRSLA